MDVWAYWVRLRSGYVNLRYFRTSYDFSHDFSVQVSPWLFVALPGFPSFSHLSGLILYYVGAFGLLRCRGVCCRIFSWVICWSYGVGCTDSVTVNLCVLSGYYPSFTVGYSRELSSLGGSVVFRGCRYSVVYVCNPSLPSLSRGKTFTT